MVDQKVIDVAVCVIRKGRRFLIARAVLSAAFGNFPAARDGRWRAWRLAPSGRPGRRQGFFLRSRGS